MFWKYTRKCSSITPKGTGLIRSLPYVKSMTSPQNDTNIEKLSKSQWKWKVRKQIKRVGFNYLLSSCSNNKKTSYLSYEKLQRQEYITVIEPRYSRVIFKARLQIFPIKANSPQMYERNLLCSSCEKVDETFHHIFNCDSGPHCTQSVKDLINCSSDLSNFSYLRRIAKFLVKYQKQWEVWSWGEFVAAG